MLLQVTDNFNVRSTNLIFKSKYISLFACFQKEWVFPVNASNSVLWNTRQTRAALLKATLKTLFVSPLFSDYYFQGNMHHRSLIFNRLPLKRKSKEVKKKKKKNIPWHFHLLIKAWNHKHMEVKQSQTNIPYSPRITPKHTQHSSLVKEKKCT